MLLTLAVAVVLLLALRAALPFGIEAWVNHVLDGTEGYQGRVEDVDLALLRGAYPIEGVVLEDTGGDVPAPPLLRSTHGALRRLERPAYVGRWWARSSSSGPW